MSIFTTRSKNQPVLCACCNAAQHLLSQQLWQGVQNIKGQVELTETAVAACPVQLRLTSTK